MSTAAGTDMHGILPLGRSLGPQGDGLAVDVRVGDRVAELDPITWAVWSLTHGLPGAVGPWTSHDVQLQAAAAGLPDAEPVLRTLRELGLTVATPPSDDGSQLEPWARQHRLVVCLPALGNSADRPDLWSLGAPGAPVVSMDEALHEVVTTGHRDPDLWTTVLAAVHSLERLDLPDPAARDPRQLLRRTLAALPTLLPVGAVHLDHAIAPVAAP